MSRFRIEHPTQPELHAYYGHDWVLGFFVEIYRGDREAPIKILDEFTAAKPVALIDALDLMANRGFFSHESLEDALLFLRDEMPEHGTAEALKIVKVIEAFKADR